MRNLEHNRIQKQQLEDRILDNGDKSGSGSTATTSVKGTVVCQLSDALYRFRYDPYEQYYILDIQQSDNETNHHNSNTTSNVTRMSGGDGRHNERQYRRRLSNQQQQQRQQISSSIVSSTATISLATIQSQIQSLPTHNEQRRRQHTIRNRVIFARNRKVNSGRRLTSIAFPSTNDYATTNHSSNGKTNHHNGRNHTNQGDDSPTSTNSPMHTEERQYIYARACLCSELFDALYPESDNNGSIVGYIPKKRPIEYCLEQFNQCTVYRDANEPIDCYKATKTIAFVATFWPLALVWMIGITYIVARTESGRTTRQYIRRKIYCCRKYKHEVSILSHPQQQNDANNNNNNNSSDDDENDNDNNEPQQQQSLLLRRRRSSESSFQLSIPSSSSSQRRMLNAIIPPAVQQQDTEQQQQQQLPQQQPDEPHQQQDQVGGAAIEQQQPDESDVPEGESNKEQGRQQQEEQEQSEGDADGERGIINVTAPTASISTVEGQVGEEVQTSPPSLERQTELAYNRQQQPQTEEITRNEDAIDNPDNNDHRTPTESNTTSAINNNSGVIQAIIEPIHVVAVSTDNNNDSYVSELTTARNVGHNVTNTRNSQEVAVGVSLEPIATAVAATTTVDGVIASNGTEVTVTEPVVVVRDHYVRMTEEEQIYHDMVELLQNDPARAAYYYRHAIIRERRQQVLIYQQVSAVYEEHLRSRQQQDQQQGNNNSIAENRQRPVREWIQRHLQRLQQQNQQQEQQGQQLPQRNNSITGVLLRRHSNPMGTAAAAATTSLGDRTGRPRPVRRRPRRGSDEYIDQTVAETDYSTNQPTVTDAADHTMTQNTQSYSQSHPIVPLTVSNTNTNTATTANGSITTRNTNLNNLNQYPFPDPFARLILKTKVYRSSNANRRKKRSTIESRTLDGTSAAVDTNVATDGNLAAGEMSYQTGSSNTNHDTNTNILNPDAISIPVDDSDTTGFGNVNRTKTSNRSNSVNSIDVHATTNNSDVIVNNCVLESELVEDPLQSRVDVSIAANADCAISTNPQTIGVECHPTQSSGEENIENNDDIENSILRPRTEASNDDTAPHDHINNSLTNTEVCCAICLTRLEDGDVIGDIPCGHLLHKDCLKNWLKRKNRCPLCQLSGVARLHDPVTGAFAFPTADPEQTRTETDQTGLISYYRNRANQPYGASDASSSWNTSSLFSSSSTAGDFRA